MNDCNSLPTFESILGRSWIDIIAVRKYAENIKNVVVSSDYQVSDHRPIFFEYSISAVTRTPRTHIWRIRYLNWLTFRKNIRRMLSEYEKDKLARTSDLNGYIERITNKIKGQCKKSAKTNSNNNSNKLRVKGHTWWSDELTVMRSKVRAFRRRWQNCSDESERPNLLERFKRERAVYKRKIYHTKLSALQDHLAKTWRQGTFGEIYNEIKNGYNS